MNNHLIIGCGVIGLTTALELLQRGDRVTLIDAAAHEGLGTSFANGGLLTPSMSDPWNAPGVHRHLLEYLFSPAPALKLRLRALPSLATWGPRFLLNARTAPHRAATVANLELSTYSLAVLHEMRRDHGLSFDAQDHGTLKIFRSAEALDASLAMTRMLEQHGLVANLIDPSAVVQMEPCLAAIRDQLTGGIFYPHDGSGDAYLFCRAAARTIRELGGEFRFGQHVRTIDAPGGRLRGVRLDQGYVPATSVIVATGVTSPDLARALGVRLAIRPVKGYSMTYAMAPGTPMPRIPVVDDGYHAALTPFGSRLRVAGTAEFAGHDRRLDPKRVANLSRLFTSIYPDTATGQTLATGQPWAGLRPVAADGRPYIGPTPTPGVWINSGHGHLGWTLAAGSARLLADMMHGIRPAINPNPFAVSR